MVPRATGRHSCLTVDVGLLTVIGLRYGQWCQYLFGVPKYRYQCPYSTIIQEP